MGGVFDYQSEKSQEILIYILGLSPEIASTALSICESIPFSVVQDSALCQTDLCAKYYVTTGLGLVFELLEKCWNLNCHFMGLKMIIYLEN